MTNNSLITVDMLKSEPLIRQQLAEMDIVTLTERSKAQRNYTSSTPLAERETPPAH